MMGTLLSSEVVQGVSRGEQDIPETVKTVFVSHRLTGDSLLTNSYKRINDHGEESLKGISERSYLVPPLYYGD